MDTSEPDRLPPRPIMTLIALFTGMALPFIAASRPPRGGPLARADAQKRTGGPAEGPAANPALMTPPPPDTCTSRAPATPTATRPRRAAGSRRCRS